MKINFLACASLCIFTSAAHAQSSVTLYGLIDVGLTYVNATGGSSKVSMSSGNINGSRWGLKGVEDLGGGLSAVFALENGFNLTNGALGQGGAEFGRQAYVGVSAKSVGTVTLGRQYDPIVDTMYRYDASDLWAPFFADHPGDLDNINDSNRVNNSIKFKSRSFGGFTGEGFYSLGGVVGSFSRNQIWAVGGNFEQGPVSVGAVFLHADRPNFSYFGSNPNASTTASNMSGSRVYSGYASAGSQDIIAAGAAYTLGSVIVGAVYSNTAFKDIGSIAGLPAVGAGGEARFHNIEGNVRFQVTPALLLGAAYNFTKGYGVNDARYHQGVLGAVYFLSKRTDLYADAIYQHVDGTDSTGSHALANITGVTASTTSNQVLTVVGVRHRF